MKIQRTCIVCGALVRNQNPRCETCSPECTRAKYSRRSRLDQIRYEMEHPNDDEWRQLDPWMEH